MKINRRLLPIKAFYFFQNGGNAPIAPFIPTLAKDLGFSAVAVGWIFSVYPLLTLFVKPLFGVLTDKFHCRKFLVILIFLIQIAMYFSIQWIPGLPFSQSAGYSCHDKLTMKLCFKNFNDKCFIDKFNAALNSTITCQIQMEYQNCNSSICIRDLGQINGSLVVHSTTKIEARLDPNAVQQGDCVSLPISQIFVDSQWVTPRCDFEGNVLYETECNSAIIRDLIRKPLVRDAEVTYYSQFWILFGAVVVARLASSIISSIGDATCFNILGEKPHNFGLQRMWGAFGWGLFSFVAGLIVDQISQNKLEKDYLPSFYLMAVLFACAIIATMSLQMNFTQKSMNIFQDVRHLLFDPRMFIFLIWCLLMGLFSAMVWNFLFWFIEDIASENACGGSMIWIKTLEGLILTVHCYAGEIPFFFFSGYILRTLGHINSMTLVLLVFGLRFLLYSILTDPWWILPIEISNGVTFGIMYATMTTYASAISPPGTEATVQSLVTSFNDGAGLALGSLIGGYMFKTMGGRKTFLILGVFAILLAVLHIIVQKLFKTPIKSYYQRPVDKEPHKEENQEEQLQLQA